MDQEPFDDAQCFKLATGHEAIWSVYAANVVLVVIVRDKSNLKIGHENYPKTVRYFFDRDLSAGHVTSFSMRLACWSVRAVAFCMVERAKNL